MAQPNPDDKARNIQAVPRGKIVWARALALVVKTKLLRLLVIRRFAATITRFGRVIAK